MHDLDDCIRAAWLRLAPTILNDPHELQKRLARRRQSTLQRPPRAYCISIRANDSRLNQASAIISNLHSPASPVPSAIDAQLVTLDLKLIHALCHPVHIDSPGEDAADVAKRLGCSTATLHHRRFRNLFSTRYVPHLAGKRGHPVPILYTPRPLDPQSNNLQMPSPLWGNIWDYRTPILSRDFAQQVKRVPIYRPAPGPKWDVSPYPSHKLPPPPPDYVWYKWKDGKYIPDKHELKHQRAKERKAKRLLTSTARPASAGRASQGSIQFNGYRWICPACKKPVRQLYLPLPRINFLPRPLPELANFDAPDAIHDPLPCFACCRCHRIRYFSPCDRNAWNELISYLSAGLLYGYEVKKPADYQPTRQRPYKPRPFRAPSQRRQQILPRLLAGESFTSIAADLQIRWRSVHGYAKQIYAQHKVTNRLALAKALGSDAPQPRNRPHKRNAVLPLLLAGHSYKQIAKTLNLTYNAVHHHAKNLYREHKVHGRQGLIARFREFAEQPR
jgi:DNA-binding NarL/FixJ family response regulator